MNPYQIAASQEPNRVVALVDTLGAFEPTAAKAACVDVARLLVAQPDNESQAFDIIDALARSGAVDAIIVFGSIRQASAKHLRAHAERTGTEIREC